MNLRSGFRFTVAPRFHDRSRWAERLALNGGVDRAADAFFPRPDWHAVTGEELRLLVDPSARDSLPPDAAALICIPDHVRRAWWSAAEQAESLDGNIPGYEGFVSQLVEFLSFKRLPLPAQCSFDVVASRPEQSSTRVNPETGRLAGLAHSAAGMPPFAVGNRTLATINLGDEATHVIVCNLLPAELHRLSANGPTPRSDGLVETFLTTCRDYPLVRVRLDPGDGLWLPECGAIHDGWTYGKREADVVLSISASRQGS